MQRAVTFTVAPRPHGDGSVDHNAFARILGRLASEGPDELSTLDSALGQYVDALGNLDPNSFDPSESLSFWINLYNALALQLAAEAATAGHATVWKVPGGFRRPVVTITGERLSLDAIEHGKVRRFKDPRIHAALVCGAISCPSLRPEPYRGPTINEQLEDQMRRFLEEGAVLDRSGGHLLLSRVFLWFGADFTNPARMPALRRTSRKGLTKALLPWLPEEERAWIVETRPALAYLPYDWGLRCSVG